MKRVLSFFIVFFATLSVVNVYIYLIDIPHVLAGSQLINADTTLTIQANQTGIHISPTLYGIMYEDISHAGDGGMYGELIRNRTFNNSTNTPVNWSLVTSSGAQGTMTLDTSHPVNNVALTTSLKLQITQANKSQRVGIANTGYWGIPVRPKTTYQASFYAMANSNFTGPLTIDIESNNGSKTYAKATVKTISTSWKQYSVKLTTSLVRPSENNQFVISTSSPGTIWFNLVSLFPPTWNHRSNGLRIDLTQKLHDMHPSFVRFPGGNFVEGVLPNDYFNWKATIGNLTQRRGHNGAWGYPSTDGLGLLEYLEWCEDLHMSPVLAVYAGYTLNDSHIPVGTPQFKSIVQDVLDEIQYATGSTKTHWGAQRAADGHPTPFKIQYVEIGNEDGFDKSGSYNDRFAAFYDALKAKYPNIKVIATTHVDSRTPDLYDEHYYNSPDWFERNTNHYDSYSRTGPKILVGEYASLKGIFLRPGPNPTPDLNDALGDASWMTGLERNSDVVVMASYAPLFVNVNAPSWPTDLIGFDALNSYGSPSYYVQKLFSLYHGDVVLPTQLSGGNSELHFVTSKVSKNGTIYLKVVNTSSVAINTQIIIKGVTSINKQGMATVLTSGSLDDVNSLANPTKVFPVVHILNDLSPSFAYNFSPHSLTVLQLTTPLGSKETRR
jgi:alpha-N-arabinofuranosidase